MANDFDVIIVGGGGAGLSAAIEVKQAGASVMVLEADTRLGGATGASAGVFYAANTSVQQARGTPTALMPCSNMSWRSTSGRSSRTSSAISAMKAALQ